MKKSLFIIHSFFFSTLFAFATENEAWINNIERAPDLKNTFVVMAENLALVNNTLGNTAKLTLKGEELTDKRIQVFKTIIQRYITETKLIIREYAFRISANELNRSISDEEKAEIEKALKNKAEVEVNEIQEKVKSEIDTFVLSLNSTSKDTERSRNLESKLTELKTKTREILKSIAIELKKNKLTIQSHEAEENFVAMISKNMKENEDPEANEKAARDVLKILQEELKNAEQTQEKK